MKIPDSIAGLIKASADKKISINKTVIDNHLKRADNPYSSKIESDLHFIAAWVLHEKNEELEDIVAAEHLALELLED